jgi:hypothetical protein
LLHLATAQPGGAFYLIDLESPEWRERSQVHGENLNHILNELTSRKLARVMPQGSGRAYRIERRGYQEITRFVADAQKERWGPGYPSSSPSRATDPGVSNPPRRPRRDILSEWVGPKSPPDGYKSRRM